MSNFFTYEVVLYVNLIFEKPRCFKIYISCGVKRDRDPKSHFTKNTEKKFAYSDLSSNFLVHYNASENTFSDVTPIPQIL